MKLFEFFNVPADEKGSPKKIGVSKEEKDSLADEIFWFIVDHDDLHKEYVLPFLSSMKDKITSPEFNKDRFTKSWKPMVVKGCNLFHKQQKLKDDPKKLFDDEFCEGLCHRLAEKYFEEFKTDSYKVGDHKL